MSPRAVAFLAVLAPVAMAQVPAAGLTATNNNYGAGCGVEINSTSTLNATHMHGRYEWRHLYGYLRQPELIRA